MCVNFNLMCSTFLINSTSKTSLFSVILNKFLVLVGLFLFVNSFCIAVLKKKRYIKKKFEIDPSSSLRNELQ